MLSIMSQPQWALPSYGPQNVRPIRSQPYERSVQDQIPVLTSASHPTTETASPKAGLFMHKWGTNLLSSAAPGPAETVASFSISFRIGRQPHVQEVREVRYPHFPNRSTSLWVLAPIYRIKIWINRSITGYRIPCNKSTGLPIYEIWSVFDWPSLQFSYRITSALDKGRIREFNNHMRQIMHNTVQLVDPHRLQRLSCIENIMSNFFRKIWNVIFRNFSFLSFARIVRPGIQLLRESPCIISIECIRMLNW